MSVRKGLLLEMKLAVLLILVIILPTYSFVVGENYQINSYIGSKPTIDGLIDTIERESTGQQEEITLQFNEWFAGGDQLSRTVKIGSSFTNDSFLYINTVVEYDNIVGGNITYLLRRNGFTKPYDAPYDLHRISSEVNSSLDGYREYVDLIHYDQIFDDSAFGGTHDSEGKCFISASSLIFELLLPLNSGDSLGYDLNVTLADQIELKIDLKFWYDEVAWDDYNDYVWSADDSCTIVLIAESAPVSVQLLSFIFCSIILFCFRVKIKKYDNKLTRNN